MIYYNRQPIKTKQSADMKLHPVWVLLLACATTISLPAQTLQTLISFNSTNGVNPYGGLTLGSDGNFYGTTDSGGSGGLGTIFQLTTNGTLTTLVSFAFTNGAQPSAPLTLGNDGNLYGTTIGGGMTNLSLGSIGLGTVFKMTTNGTLTTLAFFNYTNGATPNSALTLGNDGCFYGTTENGYTNVNGTVFKVTTNGTITSLFSFDISKTNGANPSTLTVGNDGNLYGTTVFGGNTKINDGSGNGTVFQITTNGTLTTLVSFNGTNGAYPSAGLTLGNDGNFYGTTSGDGSTNLNHDTYGTVFQITTNGTLNTLAFFNYTNGAESESPLTIGSDGNFYGMTVIGGITNSIHPMGMGTVFKVTTNGNLTLLVAFDGTNGMSQKGALTLGADGNLYGTTGYGGSTYTNDGFGDGTVFRLSLSPVITPPIISPTLALQLYFGYPLVSLFGTLGDTYTLEYSTNLSVSNWTPILIVPNLSISPFQMIDPAGVGQPSRFYRAVQSP